LDRSVMFYDADGGALGSLTLNATNPWRPAPDSATASFIDTIGNKHLRKVARYLFDRQQASISETSASPNSFLHNFLNALDNALDNIAPENFLEHQDLALLMGRPIAVLRVKLDLELEGPPATDQSWTQLGHELAGHGRNTDGFTKVKFPVRLGEYKQLNDGVVGYWTETADEQLETYFYSSEADENPDAYIQTYSESGEPVNMFLSIDDAPIFVTLLVDPRGTIQATTGILPVKSIEIPKDQYKDALKRIAITFLTAPVLSLENHLKISLPKENDFEWTWLEKSPKRQWEEIPQTVLIKKTLFDSKFPDRPDLWSELVAKKWLQPLEGDAEQALITSAVRRAFPPVETLDKPPFPVDIGQRLDNFFDAYGKRIEPFDTHISFGGNQVIREGWLQLSTAKT
jgi:hypothetical protein